MCTNEKQAKAFSKYKKVKILKDLNDIDELNKIIEEEKHLNEMNKDTFINAYDDLLIDETCEVIFIFSKKF